MASFSSITTPLASASSSPLPSTSVLSSPPASILKQPSHLKALESVRAFLESKSCYDILPESFRLIVFDNKLSITRSLQALVTNGVVSAPLYDSTTQRFAGMFTLADVVHLIQYYYLTAHEYENVIAEVESFQLESLRKIEQAIGVPPPPTISVHPDQPLSDACAALVRTHARRLPLVDRDDQTGKETIVSVLTQYRVLKFIAINCQHDCARLDQSIGSLGIGTYVSWYAPTGSSTSATPSLAPSSPVISASPLPSSLTDLPPTSTSASTSVSELLPGDHTPLSRASEEKREKPSSAADPYFPLVTATLQTSVFDVVHVFSERGISAIPIVDEDGMVINLYETVDIVDLVRQNAYQVLDQTIEVALNQRSVDFPGVVTCTPLDTLASIVAYVRERRCHRFVIIEDQDVPASIGRPARKKGSLVGILSLSDVLRFLVGHENLRGVEIVGLRGVGMNVTGEETSAAAAARRGSESSEKGGDGMGELGQAVMGLGLDDVVEVEQPVV